MVDVKIPLDSHNFATVHAHVVHSLPVDSLPVDTFEWVTALLGDPSTRLSDGDVVLAGRHLLDLVVATTIATQPCHCGATDAEHSDHAMACKSIAVMATLHHDVWAYE